MKTNVQDTSIKCFREIQEILGKRQREIYLALKDLTLWYGDATDQEIKELIQKREGHPIEPNYVRPRRFELVNELKLVGFSQKRKCKVTDRTAMAWKVLNSQLENKK